MSVARNAWGDLKDMKFGRLVVRKKLGLDKYKHQLWECVCDCGSSCQVRASNLISGHTKTCGCGHFKRGK